MRYFLLGMGITFGVVIAALFFCFFQPSDRNDKDDEAGAKAEQIAAYAKTWSIRNDDKHVEDLSDLRTYADNGYQAFIDPWGQPFQFKYVMDEQKQKERIVVWTVNPTTGKVIGAPRDLAEQFGK